MRKTQTFIVLSSAAVRAE